MSLNKFLKDLLKRNGSSYAVEIPVGIRTSKCLFCVQCTLIDVVLSYWIIDTVLIRQQHLLIIYHFFVLRFKVYSLKITVILGVKNVVYE